MKKGCFILKRSQFLQVHILLENISIVVIFSVIGPFIRTGLDRLPDDKILDLTKLKQIADNILECI